MRVVRFCFVLTVSVLMLTPRSASGTDTQPATRPAGPLGEVEKLILLEPTQGRPKFIKPGEAFYFMFRLDKLDVPKVEVSLVHSLCDQETVPLSAEAPPTAMQGNHWVMVLKPPPEVRPGVYDLRIDLGIGYQRAPRAIKVIERYRNRFRFVHLSNMNVGDPTAPDFDERLVEEINLLNPEFILATGDYLEDACTKIDPASWRKVKDFFRRFHAPSFLLCGDQDDAVSYPLQVAPNPVGTFNYGPYHFFFMMDNSQQPVETDPIQIKTLINALGASNRAETTFLVANRDHLGVLDGLRALGREPAEVFADGRVRYLLCGGSTDWDYTEYAGKIAAANLSNFTYIRTGQSSTCMKNGGTGISRYRVFEVLDSDVRFVYPESETEGRVQRSVPAGGLRVFPHGPNDHTRTTESLSVSNQLDQSFSDGRVIFRLAGGDPKSVSVVNGRIEQTFALADRRILVLAQVDLPAKTTVQVLATTDPQIAKTYPPHPPVKITLSSPNRLTFNARQTATGLRFLVAEETLELTATNLTSEPVAFRPQVRLDGQALTVRPSGDGASTQPVHESCSQGDDGEQGGFDLAPRQTIKLHVNPAVRWVRAGKNLIQVYHRGDSLTRVTVLPVQVMIRGK